jgi:oleandomycin transport system permease protein
MTTLSIPVGVSRPFPLLRHSLALAGRTLVKIRRTPEQLVDVTLQPILFLALFVYIFGGAISGSRHEYLQYLMPGILAQTIAFGSVAIGVNLNTDITKGVFDRFRSLPVSRSAPLLGAVMGDVVRYVVVTVVTVAFGTVLGFRFTNGFLPALAGCLLAIAFALCLTWVSVLVGMLARTSGAVQGITFLVMFPLSFGSNVFVKASTLPGWLQAVVRVNPLSQLVAVMRGLFTGGPVAAPLGWTALSMVVLVAVFMPLALWAYRRRT